MSNIQKINIEIYYDINTIANEDFQYKLGYWIERCFKKRWKKKINNMFFWDNKKEGWFLKWKINHGQQWPKKEVKDDK